MVEPLELSAAYAHARKLGRAEWGATEPKTSAEHGSDIAASVLLTAAHFGQTGPQPMHTVEVGDAILADVGTSPNASTTARILVALWNKFIDEAEAYEAHAVVRLDGDA